MIEIILLGVIIALGVVSILLHFFKGKKIKHAGKIENIEGSVLDLFSLIKGNNKTLEEQKDSLHKFLEILQNGVKEIKETVDKQIPENYRVANQNREEVNKILQNFIDNSYKENEKVKEHIIKQIESNSNFGKDVRETIDKQISEMNKNIKENRIELNGILKDFVESNSRNIKETNQDLYSRISEYMENHNENTKEAINSIKELKEENRDQINEMRRKVDERLKTTLEKRLGESFKMVTDKLEEMHKGLGEMNVISGEIGNIRKVLSNVKTRGVLGEYQLENLLEQILTPDQYAKGVLLRENTDCKVEFAILMPGRELEDKLWLPIDSKYPLESYEFLASKYEEGDKNEIDSAQKFLIKSVENHAREISNKYINPPKTTDFAILFLPIESLYAELLRYPGLVERLQKEYRVTLTGPTTLSALLNSLQMGFRTLVVQRRSNEVWKILQAVKTEFSRFTHQLDKVDQQLSTASNSLNELRVTRTNMISRKLKDVNSLENGESTRILSIENGERDN